MTDTTLQPTPEQLRRYERGDFIGLAPADMEGHREPVEQWPCTNCGQIMTVATSRRHEQRQCYACWLRDNPQEVRKSPSFEEMFPGLLSRHQTAMNPEPPGPAAAS